MDTTPRYIPDRVMIVSPGFMGAVRVHSARAHPPNAHPAECPIRADVTALELVTAYGSRWYGCERAWINSELRMCVSGFDERFEEMRAWPNATNPV